MRKAILFSIGVISSFTMFAVRAEAAPPKVNDPLQADIQATLGVVPTFMREYPRAALPGAWQEMKNVQLSRTTALTPKTKELIGLGVAAQIPCSYCIRFHTEAAKLNGATPEQLHEAIAVAGCTRHWSTYINGLQPDQEQFAAMVNQSIGKMKEQAGQGTAAPMNMAVPENANAAYQEMEQMFGTVPDFMRSFPETGIPGAWQDMKALELSRDTALSGKEKSLIGLAVSAQIPCTYCLAWERQTAQLNGASEEEVKEALAMAALTRKWSTVLNGLQINPRTFERELSQIMRFAAKQAKSKPAA